MYRQIIQGNFNELATELWKGVDKVIDFLVKARVISPTDRDDINQSTNNPRRRSELLLQLIVNYGQNALETLYIAVLEAELYTAADILSPINSPHRNLAEGATPSAVTDGRPMEEEYKPEEEDEGNNEENLENEDEPLDENLKRRTIRVQTVPLDSKMHQEYIFSLSPSGQRLYYTMKQDKRGRAVIIDNEIFASNSKFNNGLPCIREGTCQDRENLSQLFGQFFFVVETHRDQTAEGMIDIVKRESLFDHKKFDCFVLIILSHGKEGEIYGTDWLPVKVNQVKKIVCGTRSLLGKPKLIFVQACRGDEVDHGVEVGSDHGNTGSDFDRETDPNLSDDRDGLSDVDHDDEDEEEDEQPNSSARIIPSEADCFLAMATVSGRPAWRDRERGSWFIQEIVDVFQNNAHKHGLHKLMTKVTNQLSRQETGENKMQVSETSYTFRKTLCFFPGLHCGATATS